MGKPKKQHQMLEFFVKKSGKWFVLIMNIKKNKLVPNADGDIDVMNLKFDEIEIQTLINSAASGFYPAYHMNKKTGFPLFLMKHFWMK